MRDADFTHYFRTLMNGCLGSVQLPNEADLTFDLSSYDAGVEREMVVATERAVARCPRFPADAMREAVQSFAPTVTGETLELVAGRWLQVSPPLIPRDHEGDFAYLKINHGFWEQLYWLSGVDFDALRMRAHDAPLYRRAYYDSCFVTALSHLIQRAGVDDAGSVSFHKVSFGVSLSNGDEQHATVLQDFETMRDEFKPVVLGAGVGLIAYMRTLFGDRRFKFSDGCFPKHGLVTGELGDCLSRVVQEIDQVVFVVPPHLRGIELRLTSAPQQHLYISGTHVHEAWLPSLYCTTRSIMRRLAEGQRVLVLTQSAVFSALLGLALAEMKNALNPSGRLVFLDLGQVLDVAAPSVSGRWAARFGRQDFGIFKQPG